MLQSKYRKPPHCVPHSSLVRPKCLPPATSPKHVCGVPRKAFLRLSPRWKTPRKEGRGCLVGKPTNGGAQTPHPRARCLHTSDSSKAFISALYTLPYLSTDTRGVPAAPGVADKRLRAGSPPGWSPLRRTNSRRGGEDECAVKGFPFRSTSLGSIKSHQSQNSIVYDPYYSTDQSQLVSEVPDGGQREWLKTGCL